MRSIQFFIVPFLTSIIVHALQQTQVPLEDVQAFANLEKPNRPAIHRVAIIGAGAAGSSAAYHLSQYYNSTEVSSHEQALNITIYDPAPHAGGRSTTVNALNDPAFPIELGASIFVKINHILYNATRDFGLSTSAANSLRPQESDYSLGIWDGETFVFKQGAGSGKWSGYWDIVKLLWKYGLAPVRTQRLSKEAIGKFLKMYDDPVFPFADLTRTVDELDLLEYTSTTADKVLEGGGAGGDFAIHVVQASTRVNYAQNLGQIHGLEGLVCMAIEGAMAVEGGNWKIFEEMVSRSGAKRVQALVSDVVAHDNGTFTVKSEKVATDKKTGFDPHFDTAEVSLARSIEEEFDTVIMATPMQFSNVLFHPKLSNPPDPVPYVTLHVTLFSSPHKLSPVYFGLADQKDIPEMIITTLPEGMDLGSARGVDAVGPAGFWSISMLKSIKKEGERAQYVYKIFSPARVTGTWLASVLGLDHQNSTAKDPISDIAKTDVSWVHEKIWHSYPYEIPRTTFSTTRFSWGERSSLWYTSGIESFISTMETSALMGRNVARMVADELEMKYLLIRAGEAVGMCPDVPSQIREEDFPFGIV